MPPTTSDVRRFQLTGTVVGREAAPARVVVAHDAIDGLMPAMSMPFEMADAGVPALGDGDRIAATLAVRGDKSWLENIKVVAVAGAAAARIPVSRALPGAVVPDLPLIDQNAAPVSLRDPRGRVMVVTFLYTRCPLPDLCPLMVQHLEAVRRRVNDAGLGNRLALLGITLDPAVDTPSVLRAYGAIRLNAPSPFAQWTLATGSAAQVEDAARYFGVGYRGDGGFIVHTLATAVVGHDGRVMRVFESNSWRPDELYDVVRQGIERAAAH